MGNYIANDYVRILYTNIQRFSLHDGPGIRTTVFLKGCSLRCPWCSNPENLSSVPQPYCKDGVNGEYGIFATPDQVYSEVIKDAPFYTGELNEPASWKISDTKDLEKLPGGVTFSGGECLLQMAQLEPLLQRLNEEKIHTAVETSLYVPENLLQIALRHIDLFYVDVKLLDEVKAKEIQKGNLRLYLSNLELLMKSDWPVVIRIPVIGGMTDSEENQGLVLKLLEKYKNRILKVEIIKEHNLGLSKYRSLNMEEPVYQGVDDDFLVGYKEKIEEKGLFAEVCKV